MRTLDDLANDPNFTTAKRGEERTVTLLPDPPRADRSLLVISADDHVVEPPDTFEGRMPAKFGDRAPHVVEKDDGSQVWIYDGQELPNVGFNALVGRPVEEYGSEPVRFDQMRRGAWDIDARIADMDLNGVYASLNFPSFLPGFAGQRLQVLTKDTELAEASVRAWNDWHIEAWYGPYPDRIIPCQIPYLLDPVLGAQMIRENAERGFTSVTFPESPDAARPAQPAHRLLGSVHGGVRRDRHRHQPPRGLVGLVAQHHRRRPARRHRRAVLRLRHVRRRRLALQRLPDEAPRPEDLPVARAASAGWRG